MPWWKSNLSEGLEGNDDAGGVGIRWGESQHDQDDGHSTAAEVSHGHGLLKHRRGTRQIHKKAGKHRPRVAGDGENLPLEVLRCLSEWLAVLEERGTVGGQYCFDLSYRGHEC
jgi:putative membrane protein